MNLQRAKSLKARDRIYSKKYVNSYGRPYEFRVTSVKVWKTRPDEVEVRVVGGLRSFFKLDEHDIEDYDPDYDTAVEACRRHGNQRA